MFRSGCCLRVKPGHSLDLPDILDHLGMTPREFGSVHIHFERVRVVDVGRVIARLLLQAAFSPPAADCGVTFYATSETGERSAVENLRLAIPADGSVLAFNRPLRVPAGARSLAIEVDAGPPPPGAERVRPAWKLQDTIEVPKLSEMSPAYSDVDVNLGASLLATAALGGAGVALFYSGGISVPGNNGVTVHKARVLPALSCPISHEVVAPVAGQSVEILWRPGQELPPPPAAPPPTATLKPPSPAKMRRCHSCGFEGSAAEYERARACPSCDAPWL